MSLLFNEADNKVVVADTADLRNLQSFSILAWVHLLTGYPAADASIFSKTFNGTVPAKQLAITSTGAIKGFAERATTDATIQSAAAEVPILKWAFIGATFDLVNGWKLYLATETTPARLLIPSSSALGSGALADDATYPAVWGNEQDDTTPFKGMLGIVGLWNRALPSYEMSEQAQFMRNTLGCVDLHFLGRTNSNLPQEDYSGKGNKGILTGSLNRAPSPRFTRIPAQEF